MNEPRRRLLPLFLAALVVAVSPLTALAATDPGLGSAGNFAVLAGTTVTNTGPSWITGLLGVAPGSAVTGFPPATSGVQHNADSVATMAQTDLTTAYLNAAGQSPSVDYSGVNLGGLTLGAGVYRQTFAPTLTGTLTLDGQGVTTGVWIFQIGSALVTASGARVALINGAQPCAIFWQVGSSATIATSTTFVGNIMATMSIAMQTGATLNGRALARHGAVTLDTNRIIQPTGCGYPAPTFVPPPTGNILDTTPPILSLSSNLTVDATSPAGTVVTYTVTATDPDNSPSSLTLTCSPASGSTFPIGATTVNCSAADPAGNHVAGSFTVTVLGAAAQVSNLIATVDGFNLQHGIRNSLEVKLSHALAAIKSNHVAKACKQLDAFIDKAQAKSGKKLTASQANQLIVAAEQIQATLGCG